MAAQAGRVRSPRSVGWMVAGAIVGAGFVGVLGPGLTFT